MNIAHNFIAVADAPLAAVPFSQLMQLLFTADKPLVVVTKYVKARKHSTTVYDPRAHQLYRAAHSSGCLVTLKALARENPHIRLLAPQETVTLEAAPLVALAAEF